MKKNKNIIFTSFLCVLAVLATSCSKHEYLPKEPQVRLPFIFQVEKFEDTRMVDNNKTLADQLDTRERYTFNQDLFLKKLIGHINHRARYEYDPARLSIRLKDYAAVKDSTLQSVAFYLDLTGVNNQGKVLGSGLYSCFISDKQGINIQEVFEELFDEKPRSTKKSKDEIMWENLYNACLADIANEFNKTVIQWHTGE